MQLSPLLPLVICVIGGAVYVVADPAKYPKLQELGRLSYWVGLLTFLIGHR